MYTIIGINLVVHNTQIVQKNSKLHSSRPEGGTFLHNMFSAKHAELIDQQPDEIVALWNNLWQTAVLNGLPCLESLLLIMSFQQYHFTLGT